MLEKIPLMVKDLDNKLDDLAIIIAKELQKEKDLTFKERK